MRAPKTPVSTRTPRSRSAGRGREARAVPLRGDRKQRELADDERVAAGVEKRTVEPAVVILEDAELRDLLGQRDGVGHDVARGDAEQDAETGADRTARRHGCAGDPLDDRLHASRSRIREA
jgi:hypothetical protein